MKTSCKMLLGGIALAGRLVAALPPLAGDGVTDDTAARQARISIPSLLSYGQHGTMVVAHERDESRAGEAGETPGGGD